MSKEISFTVKYLGDSINSPYIVSRPRSVMTAYCMTRSNITEAMKYAGSQGNLQGVYFLVGHDRIYAGKTEKGVIRIRQHAETKDWWDRAIMFLSSPSHFNLNFISEMEHYAITDIKENSPYQVMNEQIPYFNGDSQSVEEFYEEIKLIMNFLGVNMNKKGHFDYVEQPVENKKKGKKPLVGEQLPTPYDEAGWVIDEILDTAGKPVEWKWVTVTQFKDSYKKLKPFSIKVIGGVLKSKGITRRSKKIDSVPRYCQYLPMPVPTSSLTSLKNLTDSQGLLF